MQESGINEQCKFCFVQNFERLIEKFLINENDKKKFRQQYQKILRESDGKLMPEIYRELNKDFLKLSGLSDPFAEEKRKSNEIALELYNDLKEVVEKSENPFQLALRLAIAGNIMDYGPTAHFDVHSTIEKAFTIQFAIDHSAELHNRIKTAKKILYLGDNAGEIVFDKLFIETMKHPNVTFAVRGAPALNDVTLEDAYQVGIDKVARVISNGNDVASTIVKECSSEFQEIFQHADLIISKGQGNLEGLIYQNDPRIFFLLVAKCDVIAQLLGVEKGSFVVYNTQLPKNKNL